MLYRLGSLVSHGCLKLQLRSLPFPFVEGSRGEKVVLKGQPVLRIGIRELGTLMLLHARSALVLVQERLGQRLREGVDLVLCGEAC